MFRHINFYIFYYSEKISLSINSDNCVLINFIFSKLKRRIFNNTPVLFRYNKFNCFKRDLFKNTNYRLIDKTTTKKFIDVNKRPDYSILIESSREDFDNDRFRKIMYLIKILNDKYKCVVKFYSSKAEERNWNDPVIFRTIKQIPNLNEYENYSEWSNIGIKYERELPF